LPHSKSPQDQTRPDRDPTANGSAPPTPGLGQRIKEARLRRLDAQARVAEAKATAAEHAAAAEPKRQKMKLKERRTRLKLEETKVKAALVAVLILLVFQAISMILNPTVSRYSALVLGLGFIAGQLRRWISKPEDDEHDPDP
jgi:hypothetical protein